jgi:hypothetical protein
VQLVATAHGITLDNLIMNPTLTDLLGGIQAVTLSDEEARRRGTQKTVLERKAPPTFDILVEIKDRNRFAVYQDIARVVDRYLSGSPVRPEVRIRASDGHVTVQDSLGAEPMELDFNGSRSRNSLPRESDGPPRRRLRRPARIYPIGVSRTRLEKAIREVGAPVRLADQPINADVVLSLKAQRKRQPRKLQMALDRGVEFYTIKSNTFSQIKEFLNSHFETRPRDAESSSQEVMLAIRQAEDAIVQVQRNGEAVELEPQNSYIRMMQHELVHQHGLRSESSGISPYRRVLVLPE